MARKISAAFRKPAVIAVAVLGFLALVNLTALSDSTNPYRVTVAQNETQATTAEDTSLPSESKAPESKADEEIKSTSEEKKPLKDFQPSERIEAEQAVDFPYDI